MFQQMLPIIDRMNVNETKEIQDGRTISDVIRMVHVDVPLDGMASFAMEDGKVVQVCKRSDKPYTYYFVVRIGSVEFKAGSMRSEVKFDEVRVEDDAQLVKALEVCGFTGFGLVSRDYWMGR